MFILGRFPKVLLVLLSGLPYKESMVMVFARYRRWHLKLLEGKNDFIFAIHLAKGTCCSQAQACENDFFLWVVIQRLTQSAVCSF